MALSIGKCGCDCPHCPTYKDNIRTAEQRKWCSAGWTKHIGIKLSPEKLRPCDGCSLPDAERKTIYLNCRVRKCAVINGVDNCAWCTAFPCDDLLHIHSLQQVSGREDFMKKGKQISETEYLAFIEPYTGLKRLQRVRDGLYETDLKAFKKFSSKTRFAAFKNGNGTSRILYSLLTSVAAAENVPYARMLALEKKRDQLIRILWTMALLGNFREERQALELDAATYLSQKINGMYPALVDYSRELEKSGIFLNIVFLDKGCLTSLGGLRKTGWLMTLRFSDQLNGVETLKKLKEYALLLRSQYGNRAFRHFNAAEMDLLEH